MNYVFYDFETTGRDSNWDQIIQVGAILTNTNFKEIDRFEARCSLQPDIIPYPKAILVNKSSVKDLTQTNLSHFALIELMIKKFKSWGTAIYIGYNSISFDEEFLRKTLFKNLYNPYFTINNGNKRSDLLNIIRANHIYYPDSLKIPINEKGKLSFKLDQIAPFNGIKNFDAHDALGDAIATIKLAKKLNIQNPELWQASLLSANRESANNEIENNKLFCVTETFFGKTIPFVVSFICHHPVYKWAQCFDLKHDPQDYINLTQNSLEHFMSKSPKIIRSIRSNKSPIIMNSSFISRLNEYRHISNEELIKRAEIINSNNEFKITVEKILIKNASEKEELSSQEDINFEETIYQSFSNNYEKIIMEEFHLSNWEDKIKIANKFKEERNYYFAEKIIYEENPSILPKEIINKINRRVAKKIFSTNDEKWNTIPKAYKDIDDLRAEYEDKNDQNTINTLNNLNNFIEDIEKKYQGV
jgi:exodeoxyribonuclease-1